MNTFLDALRLSSVGFAVVFFVLAAIAGVITLIGRLDEGWSEDEAASRVAATEKAPTIDDTTLVLITAAVAVVLRGRGRIRRIQRLQPLDGTTSPWSQKARAHLHGSHAVHHQREK